MLFRSEYQGDYDNLIDNDTTAVLEEVYDVFGKYSAWGLRNMIHQEDPWLKTQRNEEIPLPLIKDYFEKTYITD